MSTSEKTARTMMGTVVSDKMNDSIVVKVERQIKHPRYGKFIRRSTKIHAHDAGNTAQLGDVVVIQECRPISKRKSWTLVAIKDKAERVS